jgi:short-subunit dehydrogenase
MQRQRSGHIVNVASVVGKRASPFRAAYAASKFALVGLSEALRMELRRDGIRVTTVCPIGTATGFQAAEGNPPPGGGPVQSAEHVARAIVRCLRRPRAEVHPYLPARLLFLANDVAPGLVDRLLMALSPRARRR